MLSFGQDSECRREETLVSTLEVVYVVQDCLTLVSSAVSVSLMIMHILTRLLARGLTTLSLNGAEHPINSSIITRLLAEYASAGYCTQTTSFQLPHR